MIRCRRVRGFGRAYRASGTDITVVTWATASVVQSAAPHGPLSIEILT
jgi:hypothetical protein